MKTEETAVAKKPGKPKKSSKSRRKEQHKLDQIMRILFKLSVKMTVQLVNGMFAESFAEEEVQGIRYGNSEFIRDDYDRIVGDLFLTLETKRGTFHYHVEFQTLNDQSMVIRMFRYGFEKAVEMTADAKVMVAGTDDTALRLTQGTLPSTARTVAATETAAMVELSATVALAPGQRVIDFPQQLVIFLEENEEIGDELSILLRMSNGAEIPYIVPVMKYWTFSAEELRARRMYALLPLQVFGSRKRMHAIHKSRRPKAEKARLMTVEFERLTTTIRNTIILLGELHDDKEIATGDLDRILRVMDSITDYLYSHYSEYQTLEEMKQMANKLYVDYKILEEGKREGKQEGKQEVAQKLLFLGVDLDTIIQATGMSREEVLKVGKVESAAVEES